MPPLVAHENLIAYLCRPMFVSRFGFTIMSRKVQHTDLITVLYFLISLFIFLFVEVFDGSVLKE